MWRRAAQMERDLCRAEDVRKNRGYAHAVKMCWRASVLQGCGPGSGCRVRYKSPRGRTLEGEQQAHDIWTSISHFDKGGNIFSLHLGAPA